MNLNENARAKCPYYKKYKDREIQCESCVTRARMVFVFHDSGSAIKHKRAYCDDYGWQECEYAKVLSHKYDGWIMDFRRKGEDA